MTLSAGLRFADPVDELRGQRSSVIGRQLCFLPASVHVAPEREGYEDTEEAESQEENYVRDFGKQQVAGVIYDAQLMLHVGTPEAEARHQKSEEPENATEQAS